MRVVIDFVRGARRGERVQLSDPEVVRFGRHPSNEVVFDPDRDRDASARHAELRCGVGRVLLYDLGSANGTRLSGKRVNGQGTPVASGEEIEFGAGGPVCRISYDLGAPTVRDPATEPEPVRREGVGPETVSRMISEALSRSRPGAQWTVVAAALLVTVGAVAVGVRLRLHTNELQKRARAVVPDPVRQAPPVTQVRDSSGRGAEIARANHDAIFLLAARPRRATQDKDQSFCTAFAVRRSRLVTNAHCVMQAEEVRGEGGEIFAVQNGAGAARFKVTRMRRLPGFEPSAARITPDVGWLEVDGVLPVLATLADAAELKRLATGGTMYTYGFPGRLADAVSPEATFVEGVIGRLTTLDGRAGDPKELRLLQHSAFTTAGTSGSPIFDAEGHVVGVNTGGYLDAPRRTGHGGVQMPPAPAVVPRPLQGYNFGMRIDLLQELESEADQ
jgi:S1-C subfamily serine protease